MEVVKENISLCDECNSDGNYIVKLSDGCFVLCEKCKHELTFELISN